MNLCIKCGEEFIKTSPTKKYCSSECRYNYWANKHPERIRIHRKNWKKRNWSKVLADQRKSYSKKIEKKLSTILINRPCKECGNDFIPDRKHYAQQVFCTIKCCEKFWRRWENKSEYAKQMKRNEVKQRKHLKRANGGSFTIKDWEMMKINYHNTCLKCLKKEPEIKLTIDHIIPISKGGRHEVQNIQPLCMNCNIRKKVQVVDYRNRFFTMLDTHGFIENPTLKMSVVGTS